MTVRQLIGYHTLLVVFRIRMTNQPQDLAIKLKRENRRGKILVGNSRLNLYQRSFIPRGANLWNKLPMEFRNEENVRDFKKKVRIWIFQNISMFDD